MRIHTTMKPPTSPSLSIPFLLFFVFALIPSTSAYSRKNDAVLLSTVQSLTLYSNKPTTHRRVSSVPQLSCTGGNAKGLYEIDVLRCRNSGSGYGKEDVEWTCRASLPPEFKLGSTEVICEGYESSEDPYVLKGSCGVEYRLVLTERGEGKYPERMGGWKNWGSGGGGGGEGGMNWVVWVGILAFLGWILYRAWFQQDGAQPRGRNGGGGGGGWGWGGGGGGGGDDPPPPYSPRPPKPRSNYSGSSSSWGSNAGSTAQGWRPGFWSGAATGAAAAYAANNMRGGGARTGNAEAGPSNWFGGGGQAAPRAGPSRSSPSSSYSDTRYESTGFGSTSRR